MANIFEKGTKFAQTALALLRREVKTPGLFIYKFGKADFTGAAGDTISIKRPPLLRARDKGWRTNNAIIVDQLQQSRIQVTLSQHPYNAVALSSEEETLDEVDYVRDVQAPQVRSVLEFFEEVIVAVLAAVEFAFTVAFDPAGTGAVADPRKVAIKARKLFQKAHVPTSGRYWLVGANVSEAVASYDKLLEVDTSGLPEALREGVVGKLAGFVIVEVDALGEDESYFVHESAIAIATVAPVVPNGASKGGGVAAGNGLAVTQLWDYDGDLLSDRSVVHAFVGASAVLDPQVEEDKSSEDYGRIILGSDGKPVMDFFRAIKVEFGAEDTTDSATWTIQVTGSPTDGTYQLLVDGEATGPIAYNATNGAVAQALNELEGVTGVKVTGSSAKTLTFQEDVIVAADAAGLVGGTSPNVTVTKV
ncbi:P22 phage major capsid protein family protein [Paenarthrobacter nitroguajacolicus]|uniref:P22 phage major capsid protein family protein n=1 Tax=Paenarthrobacter nitroguajacolicus TaxID=211146 RepID=UPI00248B7BC7|nr:P22 phage major capsid protein family protein [Paenarthrobacter nitroguajacolicus]MDI2032991.1 hypothetical protein [Paenarthrobacter nitroguajacolicus]